MTTMRSFEIASDRLRDFRAAIPTGTEHYILPSGPRTYVNIRTKDDGLFDKIKDAFRLIP